MLCIECESEVSYLYVDSCDGVLVEDVENGVCDSLLFQDKESLLF